MTSTNFDEDTADILEELGTNREKKKRVARPKKYGDMVWNSQAKVGDVVYMPSNPEVKMTVSDVPRVNRAAWSGNQVYEVTVQWLDRAGQMTSATVDANTLLYRKQ